MSLHEGVIRFQLLFQDGAAPDQPTVDALEAWRQVFRRLGLIGQDPARYHGLGFGNLSCRAADGSDGFVISGTQTGGLEQLTAADYARVLAVEPSRNILRASGQIQPSSEAMTHGAVYQVNPAIQAVVHVHSPQIWRWRDELRVPVTAPSIDYGSPEMALAVQAIVSASGNEGVLIMGGHEDGVLAWGPSLEAASLALLACYQGCLQDY